ncbi:hypothetical protein [Iningainema tapete]|uniref:Uncharacterized protein n=1 Tax=Iningainema tapete BLCC-T55 TaxID=2748662 RepID=A0A8J6XQT9_9CYAN|nr:hypothetical protein [Iningainema tapete]MBD2771823.1 hypothetical protein [Iningainema tapete BLCC-T55]
MSYPGEIPNEIPDVKQVTLQCNRYMQIYQELQAAINPTTFEQVISVIGLQSQVNHRRIQRIQQGISDINRIKKNARKLLTEALNTSRVILEDAMRLNKTTLGTILREEPRLKVIQYQTEAIFQEYRDSILFVQTNSGYSFPPSSIHWSQVRINANNLLENLNLIERIRIQEEWDLFVNQIHELKQVKESIDRAKKIERETSLIENLCKEYIRALNEELNMLEEEFELLSLRIAAKELSAIEQYFSHKINNTKLLHLISESKSIEKDNPNY